MPIITEEYLVLTKDGERCAHCGCQVIKNNPFYECSNDDCGRVGNINRYIHLNFEKKAV